MGALLPYLLLLLPVPWIWGMMSLRSRPLEATVVLGVPALCGLGLAAICGAALLRRPDYSVPDLYALASVPGTHRLTVRPYRDTEGMSIRLADATAPELPPRGTQDDFRSMRWTVVEGMADLQPDRSDFVVLDSNEGPTTLEYTVTGGNQRFVAGCILRVGGSSRTMKQQAAAESVNTAALFVGLSMAAVFLLPVVIWAALKNREVLRKRSD